jgi:hypothetical protein
MIRGLHQAVPSRFQVVVPVRDICNRGMGVRGKKSRCGHEVKEKSNIYPLLVPPEPCDARVRLGSER